MVKKTITLRERGANNVLFFVCKTNTYFSSFCLCVDKADVCVDSLIPGLDAPQTQQHSGQPERIAASMPG